MEEVDGKLEFDHIELVLETLDEIQLDKLVINNIQGPRYAREFVSKINAKEYKIGDGFFNGT